MASSTPERQSGRATRERRWAAVAVVAHFAATLAHGIPHGIAPVPLATWQTAFVAVVVVAGPPVGLWFALRGYRRAGGGLLALTGTASFLFGTYFHFVSATPDNVARVGGTWAVPFLVTALLGSVAAVGVVITGLLVIRALR